MCQAPNQVLGLTSSSLQGNQLGLPKFSGTPVSQLRELQDAEREKKIVDIAGGIGKHMLMTIEIYLEGNPGLGFPILHQRKLRDKSSLGDLLELMWHGSSRARIWT